ncbi:MAG: autotransporter outer membrane beta-barrel domain-containing protein [Gammaproteobacteria bacterium]|nr:autotransporter outer membrane beta-barrel domain-containing protein [Gammaproteobacteria bacterium]
MPAAWLARFGRAAAGAARGGGPRRRAAKAERDAELAMAELARAIVADRHGDGVDGGPHGQPLAMQSRSMTAKEAMLGTRFSLTGARDGAGGTLAFWGRAARADFDGREGTFSLDGEATTAMLGADYARDRWLVGLALMQTGGDGGYADSGTGPQSCPEGIDPEMAHLCNGAVREGDGRVEASLTAAIPYAALQASERLRLWGALGYGTGEVTLRPEPGGSLKADIGWTMAAAGLRGDLIAPPAEGSGPALALTSDALWARTSSDRTHDLAASEGDVTRLRLGLEGSWRVAMEGGGTLVPKLEVGARHDGGDAETGFGVEFGGGMTWTDPGMGLSLDLSGRTLVAHEDGDLKDRGYSASVSWDPAPELSTTHT